jgi:hypothetical protein
MAGRRGFLGLLGAAGAAMPLARGGALGGPTVGTLRRYTGGLAQGGYVGRDYGAIEAGMAVTSMDKANPADPVREAAMQAYRIAVEREYRRRERVLNRLSFTGGVPPGVLAMRSNAPWFQAIQTERWIARHVPNPNVFQRALGVSLLGEQHDEEETL